LKQLNNTFNDNDDALNKLSNPQEYTHLPFPSVLLMPARFDEGKGKDFHFIGREIFRRLVKAVKDLERGISYNELWLYGTKGFGKSHLLAALTCYLLSLKRRVIFIPDASETIRDWVATVRKALLFAWANSKKVIDQIMKLDNPQAIIDFIGANTEDEHGRKVILIVDQMNVLELDGDDNEAKRRDADSWLQSCRSEICSIMSSSANYRSFIRVSKKERPHRAFYCHGGLTKVSFNKHR
jgi:hypothetical protein